MYHKVNGDFWNYRYFLLFFHYFQIFFYYIFYCIMVKKIDLRTKKINCFSFPGCSNWATQERTNLSTPWLVVLTPLLATGVDLNQRWGLEALGRVEQRKKKEGCQLLSTWWIFFAFITDVCGSVGVRYSWLNIPAPGSFLHLLCSSLLDHQLF